MLVDLDLLELRSDQHMREDMIDLAKISDRLGKDIAATKH